MKKVLFIFPLLMCLGITANAQMSIQKFYNFCTNTSFLISSNYTQYADDSIIIVAGITESPGITTLNTYLATLDYNLHLLNKKELYFPGKFNETTGPNTIIKIGVNKYLLAGNEVDNHTNIRTWVYQPFFIFFNNHLDSLNYKKNIDTARSRIPNSLIQDKQKNIIVTGQTTSLSLFLNSWDSLWYYDSSYLWLAKYDSNANLIWEKRLFGADDHLPEIVYGSKIILSHDSSAYLIAGFNYNNSLNNEGNFILKTDTAGNIIWKKQLPNINLYGPYIDLISLKNGKYAFATTLCDSIINNSAYYLYIYYGIINEQGDTLWTKKFAYQDSFACQGQQIAVARNGDLLILGKGLFHNEPNIVLRTDSNGNVKWYREYMHDTTNSLQQLVSISYLNNSQLLLSGIINSNTIDSETYDSTGSSSMSWFVLTDTFGCIIPGCNNADTIWHTAIHNINKPLKNVLVYPNPVINTLTIQGAENGTIIKLYNILGQLVYSSFAEHNKEIINTSAFLNSTYILELTDNNGQREMRKIIK